MTEQAARPATTKRLLLTKASDLKLADTIYRSNRPLVQPTKMPTMNSLRALQFLMRPLHEPFFPGAHLQARSLDSEEIHPVNHLFGQHISLLNLPPAAQEDYLSFQFSLLRSLICQIFQAEGGSTIRHLKCFPGTPLHRGSPCPVPRAHRLHRLSH